MLNAMINKIVRVDAIYYCESRTYQWQIRPWNSQLFGFCLFGINLLNEILFRIRSVQFVGPMRILVQHSFNY